jgi:hypothetical protein
MVNNKAKVNGRESNVEIKKTLRALSIFDFQLSTFN